MHVRLSLEGTFVVKSSEVVCFVSPAVADEESVGAGASVLYTFIINM